MKGGARLAGAIALLAGAGFVAHGLLSESPPEASADLGPAATFTSSRQCAECHGSVFAEWEGTYHALAFVDPEVRALSNDFENVQCIDCHAPRPVFETGVGKPPLPRAGRRAEGVDCISCHMTARGFAGPSARASGGCGPEHDPRISSPDFCGGCHDQHDTVKEWKETPFAAAGVTCATCHMRPVEREGKKGAGHRWPGAHDPDMIRSAVTLRASREGALVRVSVKNVGAGHHFPTDARHRAGDLILRVLRPDGSVAQVRRLDRYRNPYRDEAGASDGLPYREESPLRAGREESTLLPHGVERTYEHPVPEGSGTIEVSLLYKLTPYPLEPEAILADGKAVLVHREVVPF